ncbi:MAG: glycoside hydrolase family 3 protein, partial [Bifidobacterium castoris]|nr:glycoside hydrolase family 3 protein [Bifidobacterium castoris]
PEVAAFTKAIREGRPAMVMMSLASYAQLDPDAPAAFSRPIVTGLLRERTGYDGVVISDSLSADAVGGVEPTQLGVRLIEAGGDVACINDPSYTAPILSGLRARAAADAAFADKVTASATRVVAMKIGMGLID